MPKTKIITVLKPYFPIVCYKLDYTEFKDIESVLSEPLSYQEHQFTDHQEKDLTLTKNRKRNSELQYYSDTEEMFCPSPLPLPNYNFGNTMV